MPDLRAMPPAGTEPRAAPTAGAHPADTRDARRADMGEVVARMQRIDTEVGALGGAVDELRDAAAADRRELGGLIRDGMGAVADLLDDVQAQGDLRGQLVVAKVGEHHALVVARLDAMDALLKERLDGIEKRSRGVPPWVVALVALFALVALGLYAQSNHHDAGKAIRDARDGLTGLVPTADAGGDTPVPEPPHAP